MSLYCYSCKKCYYHLSSFINERITLKLVCNFSVLDYEVFFCQSCNECQVISRGKMWERNEKFSMYPRINAKVSHPSEIKTTKDKKQLAPIYENLSLTSTITHKKATLYHITKTIFCFNLSATFHCLLYMRSYIKRSWNVWILLTHINDVLTLDLFLFGPFTEVKKCMFIFLFCLNRTWKALFNKQVTQFQKWLSTVRGDINLLIWGTFIATGSIQCRLRIYLNNKTVQ